LTGIILLYAMGVEASAPAPPAPELRPTSGVADVARLLSHAERCVTRRLAEELGDCSVEQWRALTLLADGNGHRMSELAEFVMVPAPSLTRLIDRMVSDNLVYRRVDPHDRRRVLVHLTRRGDALHRGLAQRIENTILADGRAHDVQRLAALLTELVVQSSVDDLA
jgi:DNA-binding MarR family transcriptional regulator